MGKLGLWGTLVVSLLANLVLLHRLSSEGDLRIVVRKTAAASTHSQPEAGTLASIPRVTPKSETPRSVPPPETGRTDASTSPGTESSTVHSSVGNWSTPETGTSVNNGSWSDIRSTLNWIRVSYRGDDPFGILQGRLDLTPAQVEFLDQVLRSQLNAEQRKKYEELRSDKSLTTGLGITGWITTSTGVDVEKEFPKSESP